MCMSVRYSVSACVNELVVYKNQSIYHSCGRKCHTTEMMGKYQRLRRAVIVSDPVGLCSFHHLENSQNELGDKLEGTKRVHFMLKKL